ncbi:hypothetical protein GFS31_32840 [Leptolyngbya sp. BL0902]|uniref:PAS domain S-box protein n=1 Tax=Leptolyngbya sp. BL0902 TaxID=1115757 RepID=UPI0018E8E5D1|nr:PAS domain S-box protein [Leptolyngbya sp. BL0902]QQE66584.1 hypothetical protein GFS31_32840 [Leptolyngbya sp. BL0902]
MFDALPPLPQHRAVMTAPLTVEGKASVRAVLAQMAQAKEQAPEAQGTQDRLHQTLRESCVVVVDAERRVRGLLTAVEGVRRLGQEASMAQSLAQGSVEQVMTPVSTVWRVSDLPDWPEMVAALAQSSPVPVVDDQDRLVGLVGIESVAAMMAEGPLTDPDSSGVDRMAVLQDRETRYQALMDRASDAIMIADLEGHILEVNRQAEKLLGYTMAELSAMHFTQLHPPEDLPRVVAAFEQLANQQVCQVLDVNFRRQDGQVVPVDISASVISLPDRPIIQGIFRDIRERKAMEQALRHSEGQYRQIIDTASEGIWVIDAEGYTLMGNPALAQSLGIDQEAMVGQSLFQFVDEADRPALEAQLQCHQLGRSGQYELPLRSRDGTQRIMLASVSPRMNGAGTCTGMTLMLTDITDRKHMETSLAAKTEELDRFFSVALDLLCIASIDGRFARLNQQWETVLGYPVAELEGREFLEFVHPDDLAGTLQEMTRLDQGGVVLNFVNRYRCRDGQYRWIEWRSAPRGTFIYAAARDITDRVRAEQQEHQRAEREQVLREITQRIRQSLELQTIFDTACPEIRQVLGADRVGVFRFDSQIQIGAEAQGQTGQFVAESVGAELPSILAVPVPDYGQRVAYQPIYQGHPYVTVPDLLALDPREHSVLERFQVRASLVVPLISGDKLWGLLCVHQCHGPRPWSEEDIALVQHLANQIAIAIYQASLFAQIQQELAERQQAQQRISEQNQQLALSNQELARATRLKDEFLATMSHELRTPLNAVLGMAEGMQDLTFGPITPEQRHALQIIDRSGNHLLELINDILDVAKIEAGQITLDRQPTEVSRLCAASLAFIASHALKKQIQIHTDMAPQLPTLWLDERRMRQVLINLLSNAVKFTPEGGEITLTASVSPMDQRLQIAVSDTGIGIAEADQSRLFQPFVQIDSALNRQYAGTGLGLALVKQIVELHGGTVALTSTAGVGSCFTVDLPLVQSMTDDLPLDVMKPLPAVGRHPPPSADTLSPLILLAEDNEANILTLTSYLEAKGYRLRVVNNGQDAVEATLAEPPNLVLMDIQMPGMDGLTAIQQIRQHPHLATLPIIALTALAMEGDRERCLQAGANHYLSKPVRLKELLGLIQSLLPASPN